MDTAIVGVACYAVAAIAATWVCYRVWRTEARDDLVLAVNWSVFGALAFSSLPAVGAFLLGGRPLAEAIVLFAAIGGMAVAAIAGVGAAVLGRKSLGSIGVAGIVAVLLFPAAAFADGLSRAESQGERVRAIVRLAVAQAHGEEIVMSDIFEIADAAWAGLAPVAPRIPKGFGVTVEHNFQGWVARVPLQGGGEAVFVVKSRAFGRLRLVGALEGGRP